MLSCYAFLASRHREGRCIRIFRLSLLHIVNLRLLCYAGDIGTLLWADEQLVRATVVYSMGGGLSQTQ